MLIQDITRDSDNKLPTYAWPGGYTIVYYCGDGEPMCADCATDAIDNPFDNDIENPQYAETYDEGPSIYCVNCNKELVSSYGDPDSEEEGA